MASAETCHEDALQCLTKRAGACRVGGLKPARQIIITKSPFTITKRIRQLYFIICITPFVGSLVTSLGAPAPHLATRRGPSLSLGLAPSPLSLWLTRPRAVRALAAMAPKTGSSNGPVPKGLVTIPLDDISTGPGSSWRVRDDERAMELARTFMKGDYLKTILIKPTLLSENGVPKVIG